MKKLLFILLIMALNQTFMAMDNSLEVAFREKYKHLDIPKFEYENASNDQSPYSYHENEIKITIREKILNDFFILHELGHHVLSQKGLNNFNAQIINGGASLITMALWGRHKLNPYKNIVTKFGSKGIASFGIYNLSYLLIRRFHETYADNFALNNIQDKEPLEKTIKFFKKEVNEIDQMIEKAELASNNCFMKNIGLPIIFNMLKIYSSCRPYPSYESRSKKIEYILKERFTK